MDQLKAMIAKYREGILYLFFGGCTTLVNIVVYALATRALGMGTVAASVLGWLLSVLFAYATNRKWVFESAASGTAQILSEMGKFFAGRIATGVMDIVIMYLAVDVLGAPDMVLKILSNVLVIVLNYFISKLLVFRQK